MATKRSSKRVKRSTKRPANRALSAMNKGAKTANLSPKRAAKKTSALAKRGGSSRELMSRKQTPWTNALGEVRKKTPSKPGDATYTNKVEFICRNPETGDEKTVYHKARAKSCADKGWDVLARPRPRPEKNPRSKKYAGRTRA